MLRMAAASRSLQPSSDRARRPQTQPLLAAPRRSCCRPWPVCRQAAAAAAGSNGSGPTSSSSSFSNDSSKREDGAAPDGKGKGSSHMLDASDSAASIASGSGGSSSSGPGSEPSRRRRQQQQQQQQGAPPEPRTRLGRALAFLAALRSRLALRRLLTMAFMFAVGSLMSLASSRSRVAGPQELMYSEFLNLVHSGNVRACRFEESSSRISFDLRPHSSQAAAAAPHATVVDVSDATISAADSALVTVRGHGPAPRQFWTKRLAADSSLIPTLLAAGVEFGVLRQSMLSVLVRVFGSALMLWIPLMPLFFIVRQFMRSQAGTPKKRKPSGGSEVPATTFADVAGMNAAKRELAEVVACLKNSSKFARLGAQMPSGVLLSGPPGTGKTLLARAVAGEAGVPFFAVSASEFVELELFAEARAKAPCVVFIDELDAVGGKRGMGLNEERDQTLNQLLTELDGFEGRPGVLLLAATNRPEVLDPALMRPGRLSRKVVVPLPDEAARQAIVGVHLARVPLGSRHERELACEAVAKITSGFSGAELANVVNEAAFLAARTSGDAVGLPELVEAVQRTRYGVNGGGDGGGMLGLGLQQRLRVTAATNRVVSDAPCHPFSRVMRAAWRATAALRRRLASALSGPAQAVSQLIECTGAHASSAAKPGLAALWQQQVWQSWAAAGTGVPSTKPSSSAAQRLLQLSQQHDTQAAGDRDFYKQLTAEERLARIQMLLQQGVTEETVQRLIERNKGGPYMQSASVGAAVLAVLRGRGCSDAELNQLLSWQPNILARAASSIGDVFAVLDDMLQLSRPNILRVCLKQSSLLRRSSDKLRQRWAWVQAHYGLSEAAVASLAKRMVNWRRVCGLLTYNQDTIMARLSGLQRLFELSDAEVSKLFPYLAVLLEADPEQHIRPRWDLYQSLLGGFTPADKRRFIISPEALLLPETTIRSVFSGVEQLLGSTAAAQSLLLRSPKSLGAGIKRLATNLCALQQLYGCSLQQAQQALLLAPQLAQLKLEAPKFQCRVAAVTEWYGHASPAAMLLAPSSGTQLTWSMWKLGARMAFIRRLRMERGEPELNTKQLAEMTQRFCRALQVSEEEYAAFEQRWLASPQAAELCRHEGPPRVKIIGAPGHRLSGSRADVLPFLAHAKAAEVEASSGAAHRKQGAARLGRQTALHSLLRFLLAGTLLLLVALNRAVVAGFAMLMLAAEGEGSRGGAAGRWNEGRGQKCGA
ncbi:putative inactive ATP-dependent zinc metalloprotease FTSHI 3 [Chlorella vulgaris]